MCEEESDDQEAVAKLFEINDSIHRTIERYKLIKNGDVEAAQKIPQGTLGTSTGVGKNAKNELSLIDFGGDAEPTPPPTSSAAPVPSKPQSVEDDLLGLSMQDSGYGQGGGIALGFGANTNIPGPALLSSTTQQSSAKAQTPGPPTQQPQPGPPKPNYDAFAAFSKPQPSSQSATPAPSTLPQPQQTQQPRNQPSSDPFGILSNPSQPAPNPLYNPASQNKPVQPPAQYSASSSALVDDDWNFSSALPEDGLPTNSQITVSQKEVAIVFEVSRRVGDETVIDVLAKFSNRTSVPITEYTFQVAVTRVRIFPTHPGHTVGKSILIGKQAYNLKLTPQSGRRLQPLQNNGITQPIEIHGVAKGQAERVKIRWKASYKAAGDVRQDQGEVPPLGIA